MNHGDEDALASQVEVSTHGIGYQYFEFVQAGDGCDSVCCGALTLDPSAASGKVLLCT